MVLLLWYGNSAAHAQRQVDRRALPAPNRARPDLKEAFVAPCNSVEQLAQIWAQVLKSSTWNT